MKTYRFLTVPILSIGVYFIFATQFPAQSTPLPYSPPAAPGTTFTIFFNGGSSYVVATSNNLVGLQPNQVVDVWVQLFGGAGGGPPPDFSGETIVIQPLDGGSIVSGSNTVTTDTFGSFTFSFQAGPSPGVNQISLNDGFQEIGIQFWVLDPSDPGNNPPVINQ